MKKSKWLVLAVALGMMLATGGYLARFREHMQLGAPGVKVGPGPLYNELGHLVARQSVLLPDRVLGIKGANLPVTQLEVDSLPKDTTFGRKLYSKNDFRVMTSVVLMGSDRTSIHQPQYCLDAQGWHIEQTDRIQLAVDQPYPYQLPVLKLTATQEVKNMYNQPVKLKGIYVYWFISADRLTADPGNADVVHNANDAGKRGAGAVGLYIVFYDLPSGK